MALTETGDGDKKEKQHDRREKQLTKVIIRRLPPSMDQETFFNQLAPIPSHDYFYIVKGDASLGENAFARAYINFTNSNDIYEFKEKFDNYVFLDKTGHEYPAVVEFSSFQKIPKRRAKVKVDSKIGTIENDSYYQEFVQFINQPPTTQDEKPEYSYQITKENKNNTLTPLLEFVKNRRAEKMRVREERREERKRKDFERRKFRDEERKKRNEEKSPIKIAKNKSLKEGKNVEEKADVEPNEKVTLKLEENKPSLDKDLSEKSYFNKNREKKYEKREPKNKFPKKEYEKREYKSRDHKERQFRQKSQFDDLAKFSKLEETKAFPKKVKKYSERREERKLEAQKAEQKKLEQVAGTSKETEDTSTFKEKKDEMNTSEDKTKNEEIKFSPRDNSPERNKKQENREEVKNGKDDSKSSPRECKGRSERHSRGENQSQRRIRNKDRPTIAIYRPGMLSKTKKQPEDGDPKETDKNE